MRLGYLIRRLIDQRVLKLFDSVPVVAPVGKRQRESLTTIHRRHRE